MDISLYTHDKGPKNNLDLIAAAAKRRKWSVRYIDTPPLGAWIDLPPSPKPDTVITAISSGVSGSRNDEELELIRRAGELGILTLVIADTHRSAIRPAAHGKIGNAIAVVAAHREIDDARTFGYRDVRCFGCPPAWQDFWNLPKVERPTSAFTVYIGGIKSPIITDGSLTTGVVGVSMALGKNWALIARFHPVEQKPKDDAEAARWRDRRDKILAEANLIPREDVPSEDFALMASDISFHTSEATATVKAAMNRLPVGYFESPASRENLRVQSGSETWWPAEVGAAILVTTPDQVAHLVESVLRAKGTPPALRKAQEQAYPEPPAGLPRVEEQILDFVAQSIT